MHTKQNGIHVRKFTYQNNQSFPENPNILEENEGLLIVRIVTVFSA